MEMEAKNSIDVDTTVTKFDIGRAERILIDNGIDKDEADTVLQAMGYVLLGIELYK